MSVSSIFSSSFMNPNISNLQNQQQIQQQFQALAQEFQSGNLSPAQTTALQQGNLQSGATTPSSGSTTSATDSTNLQSGAFHHPIRGHHPRHAHLSSNDSDSDQTTTAPSLGQLGQAVQSGSSSTAQQAYGSLQQDVQQIALNSDLINAQSAALQSSGLSLTV